jgi:hypothetical protein
VTGRRPKKEVGPFSHFFCFSLISFIRKNRSRQLCLLGAADRAFSAIPISIQNFAEKNKQKKPPWQQSYYKRLGATCAWMSETKTKKVKVVHVHF